MRLLLIESAPGEAYELEDRLVAAGHRVVSCYDVAGRPCVGVDRDEDCPLSAHVDLAVLARSEKADRTLNEAGVVCAGRRHVPVVRVESPEAQAELALPGEIESAAVRATARVEHGFAERIEQELAEWDAVVSVGRHPRRIAVTVRVPGAVTTAGTRMTIADRARAAARAYDPFVQVIDVAVVDAGADLHMAGTEVPGG